VKVYNNWVCEIKATIPEEQLLIFNVKEGWEPLCKFLDVPIPDVPFPRTNDRAQMQKMAKVKWWIMHGMTTLVVAAFSFISFTVVNKLM